MSNVRIRIIGLVALAWSLVLWARIVYLQVGLAAWHRAVRAPVQVRLRSIPALRGRILGRDGTVLAQDRCEAALAVHYRYLEWPLNEQWLTEQARRRLAPSRRKDAAAVAAAKRRLRAEVLAMRDRLARLAGLEPAELDRRARRVQQRVERVAEAVNRRRRLRWQQASRLAAAGHRLDHGADDSPGTWQQLLHWLADRPGRHTGRFKPVPVAEQYQYWPLIQHVSQEAILEFATCPERYPGVRLQQQIWRVYPQNDLACAVIGYVRPGGDRSGAGGDRVATAGSGVGLTGLEAFYEDQLRGQPGWVRERVEPCGRTPQALGGRPPQAGSDIVVTLDLRLQRYAERLLDRGTGPTDGRWPSPPPGRSWRSGAIVLMEADSGAVLVAACTPRYDLNAACQPGSPAAVQLAERADRPLYNRIVQMALPPGSVFKPVTAVAALAAGVDPHRPYYCRGYLHSPERFRCMRFVHHGIGHGDVDMVDALAFSCNVYFFRLAEQVGWPAIARWAVAFGFGRPSGIDIGGESSGALPGVPAARPGPVGVSGRRRLSEAIGQGKLLATPIQVAVMMAAVANGGRRVIPHVRSSAFQPPVPVPELPPQALELVRRGLRKVVADPRGTGHRGLYLPGIAIAGKTGTAQSGSPLGDHGWFAGYFPADKPRYVLVVALEHAGDGSHAAGALARALVQKMAGRTDSAHQAAGRLQ